MKRTIYILIFTSILFSLSALAEPKEKSQKTKIGTIHRIHSFTSQWAPWNIQTTIGGPFHFIALPLLEPWNFGKEKVGRYNLYISTRGEHVQIGFGRTRIVHSAYSFGAFHKGGLYPPEGQSRNDNDVTKHELGHATASEVMGPLYIPIILASYAIHGHPQSFFEYWADLEKDQANNPLDRRYKLTLQHQQRKNGAPNFNNVSFSMRDIQVQQQGPYALQRKIWEFMNISMHAPTNCSSCVSVQKAALSRKRISMKVEKFFGLDIAGDTTLMEYETDGIGGHQIRPIFWRSNYGFILAPSKNFKVYANYGPSASIATSWKDRFSLRSTDMNFGHNAEVGVIMGEAVRVKAFYEHLYGVINGTRTTNRALLIETLPHMRLHVGGGLQSTVVTDESGTPIYQSDMTGASFGFAF